MLFLKNRALLRYAKKGNLNKCRSLITEGADVNFQDSAGVSPLIAAVLPEKGYYELVELFISRGGNIHQKDVIGRSPLSYAVANGFSEIVSLLIRHGADVNEQDEYGITPILVATMNNRIEIIKILHKAGADINQMNFRGLSCILCSITNKNMVMLETIIALEANLNIYLPNHPTGLPAPLIWAMALGEYEMAKTLVSSGADVNVFTHHVAFTNRAIWAKDNDLLRMAIERGADLNFKDISGTPLENAIKSNSLFAVSALLEAGANIDNIEFAKSLWKYVTNKTHPRIKELLTAYGAK